MRTEKKNAAEICQPKREVNVMSSSAELARSLKACWKHGKGRRGGNYLACQQWNVIQKAGYVPCTRVSFRESTRLSACIVHYFRRNWLPLAISYENTAQSSELMLTMCDIAAKSQVWYCCKQFSKENPRTPIFHVAGSLSLSPTNKQTQIITQVTSKQKIAKTIKEDRRYLMKALWAFNTTFENVERGRGALI